jgi:pimeloyl-ACP methyl ester carboxylesterase
VPVQTFGSYYAGGGLLRVEGQPTQQLSVTRTAQYVYDPNGTYPIEHAWVQYFVPVDRNDEPPVVLLHGGGLHGGIWDTTPDGRPGWTQVLVDRGYEVHVVDNVERGRAGWVPGGWPGQPVLRNLEDAWTLFRFGEPSGFASRTPFTGCRFPIEHLETLGRAFCPRWLSNTPAQISAFESVLSRLQRAIIICHSQGGEIAMEAASRHPEHVHGLIAIEPSGFASSLDPLRHFPMVICSGDRLDSSPMWISLSERWRQVVAQVNDLGGSARLLDLAQHWPGTTHMPMLDLGSEHMLDCMLSYLPVGRLGASISPSA